MTRRRWPLQARLAAVVVAVTCSVLAVTMVGFMTLLFRALHADVDTRLLEARTAARHLPAGTPAGTPAASPVLSDLAVVVVDGRGDVRRVVQRQNRAGPPLPARAQLAAAITAAGPITAGGDDAWRLLADPLPDGTWLVTAQPVSEIRALHAHLVASWLPAAALVLLVTSVLTVVVIHFGLRPLTLVAAAAGRIRDGDPAQRLPVTGRDEVGRLASALNGMLARVQRSLAEQRRAEDALRQFVDDAGHELRTPVTAIRGWADLYRRGGVPPGDLPTAMRRIEDEARRIGLLVDDLLQLASWQRQARPDQARAAFRPVDLGEVVRDAVLDAQVLQPARPLGLHLPPAGTALVQGDPAALHQVIANLLDNVRTHTPESAAARVELGRAGPTGTEIVLRVVDEGPGVPEHLRDRVLDRFFRVRPGAAGNRATSTGGGTGLGLAIVAAIVADHQGGIAVEPVPTGFAIRVTLPGATSGAPARTHRTSGSST